ncbi:MAG: 16S rRNA (uracil(1498)-N(3))-methyltransferase [Clostridia bacterium]|nr:16S rRNA (uracil(1498)-N(3))-methyltransferase [Clostridia bacterium]
MFNFFIEEGNRHNNRYIISGADYNHIKNVLRMKIGDLFLVSENNVSNLCRIESLENESVIAEIIEERFQDTSLPIKIYLFQGLPKSDKLELIIPKAVELGVEGIIPVEMNRCVVKLDEKKKKNKTERWQAIAESAAKQSKRTSVPRVYDVMTYKDALTKASELDVFMVPYECKDEMKSTVNTLSKIKKGMSVGILIGPEGGFELNEIDSAVGSGGLTISLGKRILRTETAAITAVGMCMLYAEMYLNGEE